MHFIINICCVTCNVKLSEKKAQWGSCAFPQWDFNSFVVLDEAGSTPDFCFVFVSFFPLQQCNNLKKCQRLQRSYCISIFYVFCIEDSNKRTAYSDLGLTVDILFHCSSRNNSGKVPHDQEC